MEMEGLERAVGGSALSRAENGSLRVIQQVISEIRLCLKKNTPYNINLSSAIHVLEKANQSPSDFLLFLFCKIVANYKKKSYVHFT